MIPPHGSRSVANEGLSVEILSAADCYDRGPSSLAVGLSLRTELHNAAGAVGRYEVGSNFSKLFQRKPNPETL
jgi:hypothetical protein